MADIDEEVLQDLYAWVDQIPLSRPKKNIARDFSDGVMMAELVKHYFPSLIELHNYPMCHATAQKVKNWQLLNRRAFKKLDFELSSDVIENIVNAKAGTMERVLLLLRTKMDRSLYDRQRRENHSNENFLLPGHDPPSPGTKRNQLVANVPHSTQPHQSPPRTRAALPGSSSLLQSDYVTVAAYEEKVHECLAKDETIEILQAKLRRLEHLLHLKDVRIEDLQSRLEELLPSSVVVRGGANMPQMQSQPVQIKPAVGGGGVSIQPMNSPKRHVLTKYQ